MFQSYSLPEEKKQTNSNAYTIPNEELSQYLYSLDDHNKYYGSQLTGSAHERNASLADLSDLENYRGTHQPWYDVTANSIGRFAGSTGTKFLEGFGYVGAFVPWAVKGFNVSDIADVTNNSWSSAFRTLEQDLKDALPVYKSKLYREGDLSDLFKTNAFWGEDVVDGAAFMASAFIPAGVFSKVGKLMGISAKIGSMFEKLNAASKVATEGSDVLAGVERVGEVIGKTVKGGTDYAKLGERFSKGLTVGVHTLYNTVSESMFEAKDFRDSYIQQMQEDRANGLNNYADSDILYKANEGTSEVFNTNAALLIGPNIIQGSMMFGGLITKMKKGLGLATGLEKVAEKGVSTGIGKYIGTGLLAGTTSAISEGLEEDAQAAIQKYEKYKQLGMTDMSLIEGIADGMTNGLASSTDTQKQVFLGALLGMVSGGIMGGIEQSGEDRKTNLLHSLIKDIKDPDVLSKKMKDYYVKDDNGKFKKDENGSLVRDVKKMAEAISQGISTLKSSGAFFDAIAKGDYNMADYIWFNHVADKAYGLLGEDDSVSFLKNLFKGGIKDMLTQNPDLATPKEGEDAGDRIEAIEKKFNGWIDAMKKLHDIADKTTADYDKLGLDRKKDVKIRETIKNKQYKNSLKQFYLENKIEEEEEKLSKYDSLPEAVRTEGLKEENTRRKDIITSLEQELELTVQDYKDLISKEFIKDLANKEREFNKEFKGTKEEKRFASSFREGLQSYLKGFRTSFIVNKKTSDDLNSQIKKTLTDPTFQTKSSEEKVMVIASLFGNVSNRELTHENKELLEKELLRINDKELSDKLDEIGLLTKDYTLIEGDPEQVKQSLYNFGFSEDVIDNLYKDDDNLNYDIANNVKEQASQIYKQLSSVIQLKAKLKTDIGQKESVDKTKDLDSFSQDDLKENFINETYVNKVKSFETNLDNPDYTQDPSVKNTKDALTYLKKIMPQMYEFKDNESLLEKLNKIIDDAIERLDKVSEELNRRKQDRDALEQRLQKEDSKNKLGSIGIIIKDNKISDEDSQAFLDLFKDSEKVLKAFNLLKNAIKDGIIPHSFIEGLSNEINSACKDAELNDKVNAFLHNQNIVAKDVVARELETTGIGKYLQGLNPELKSDSTSDSNQDGVYYANPRANLYAILNQLHWADITELGFRTFLTNLYDFVSRNNNSTLIGDKIKSDLEQLKSNISDKEELSRIEEFEKRILKFLDVHEKLVSSVDALISKDSNISSDAILVSEAKILSDGNNPAPSLQQRVTFYQTVKALRSNLYDSVIIKGIAGSGKTMLVRWIVKALGVLNDQLLVMSYDQETVDNLRGSLNIEKGEVSESVFNGKAENFQQYVNDLVQGKKLVVFDEFAFLTKDEVMRFRDAVEKSGTGTKILFLGDPSQLMSNKEVDQFAYKSTNKLNKRHQSKVYEASSLNLKYRTAISDIDSISEMYQNGSVFDRKERVSYVDNLQSPSYGAGVFSEADFVSKLINNIKLKSSVTIIYNSEKSLAKIKELLVPVGDLSLHDITFLHYESVQGKTKDNVYVYFADDTFDVTKDQGKKDYQRAMYVATSRAKNLLVVHDGIINPIFNVQESKNLSNAGQLEQARIFSARVNYLNDIRSYLNAYNKEYGTSVTPTFTDQKGNIVEVEFTETKLTINPEIKQEVGVGQVISEDEDLETEKVEQPQKSFSSESQTAKVLSPQYGLFDDSVSVGDEVIYFPKTEIRGKNTYTTVWIVKKLENGNYLKVGVVDSESKKSHPKAVQDLFSVKSPLSDANLTKATNDTSKDSERNNVYTIKLSNNEIVSLDVFMKSTPMVKAVVKNFSPIRFVYDEVNRDINDINLKDLTRRFTEMIQANNIETVTSIAFEYKIYKKLSNASKEKNNNGRILKKKSGIPYIKVIVKTRISLEETSTPTHVFHVMARPKTIAKSSQRNKFNPIIQFRDTIKRIDELNKIAEVTEAEYGSYEKNGLTAESKIGKQYDRTKGSTFYALMIGSLSDDIVKIENRIKEKLSAEEYEELIGLRVQARKLAGTKTVERETGFKGEDVLKGIMNPKEYTEEDIKNNLVSISANEYRKIRRSENIPGYQVVMSQELFGKQFDIIKKRIGTYEAFFARRSFKLLGDEKDGKQNVVYSVVSIPVKHNGIRYEYDQSSMDITVHSIKMKVPTDITDEEEFSKHIDKLFDEDISNKSEKKHIPNLVHSKNKFSFDSTEDFEKIMNISGTEERLAMDNSLPMIMKSKFDKESGEAQKLLDEIALSNVRTNNGTNIRTIHYFKGTEAVKSKSLINSNPTPATKSYYTKLNGETVEYQVEPITLDSLDDITDFDNNGLLVNIPMDDKNETFTDNRQDVTFRLADIQPTTLEIIFDEIKKESQPKQEIKTEETKKKNKYSSDDNYDEGKTFTGKIKTGKKLTTEKAREIINEIFPGIQEHEIQFVDASMMTYLAGGRLRWGLYKQGVVFLLQDNDGTVYENVLKHEAFHRVFWNYLSPSERESIIKNAKEYKSSLIGKGNDFIEEYVADEFAKYAKNKATKLGKLIRFFKKIFNYLTFSQNNWNNIEKYFDKINNGFYSFEKVIDNNPSITRTMALTNRYMMNVEEYENARRYVFNLLFKRLYPADGFPVRMLVQRDENGNTFRKLFNIPLKKTEIYSRLSNMDTYTDSDGDLMAKEKDSLLNRYFFIREEIKENEDKLKTAESSEKSKIQIALNELNYEKKVLDYLLYDNNLSDQNVSKPKNLLSIFKTYETGQLKTDDDVKDEQEFESNLVNEISDGTETDWQKNINSLVKDILLMTAVRDVNDDIQYIPNYGKIFNMLIELTSVDIDSDNIRRDLANLINEKFSNRNDYANALFDRLINRPTSLYNQMVKTSFEMRDKQGNVYRIQLPTNMRFLGEDKFLIATNGENIRDIDEFNGIKIATIDRSTGIFKKSSSDFMLDIFDALKKYGLDVKDENFDSDTLTLTAIKNMLTKEKSRQHWISLMSFIKSIRYRNLVFGTTAYNSKTDPLTGSSYMEVNHIVSEAGNVGNLRNSTNRKIKNAISSKTVKSDNVEEFEKLIKSKKNDYDEKLNYVVKFLQAIGLNLKTKSISIPENRIDSVVDGVTKTIVKIVNTIETNSNTKEGREKKSKAIDEYIEANIGGLMRDISSFITKADADDRSYNIFGKDKKMRYTNVMSSWALNTLRDIIRKYSHPSKYSLPKHLQNKHYSDYNIFVKEDSNGNPMSSIYDIYDWMISAYKGIDFAKEYSKENDFDFIRREFVMQFASIIARDGWSNHQTYYMSPYAISNKNVMHAIEVDLLNNDKIKEAIKLALLQEFDKVRLAEEMKSKSSLPNTFESSKFTFGHLAGRNISDYSVEDIDELASQTYDYILNNAEKEYLNFVMKNGDKSLFPKSNEYSKAHKHLVDKGYLNENTESKEKDLYILFSLNNYVNTHFMNQLYMGNTSFLGKVKGIPAAIVKRASSVFGIGQSPYTGVRGIRNSVRIGIMEDFWDIKTPLNDWSGKYQNAIFTPYEVTNAETYMTPEYFEQLKYNGFGYDYNMGDILKPILWYVGEDGNPYMLKTSVVVITDELAADFPELAKIRERMSTGGMDMMTYPSGFKFGYPKSISKFFALNKGENSFMDVDAKDIRIQFNPYHEDEQKSGVKLLTQFTYIASLGEHNMADATDLYTSIANIIKTTTDKYNRKVFNNGELNQRKLRQTVIDALSRVSGSELISDALSYKASAEDKGKLIFELENGRAPSEGELAEFINMNNISSGYLIDMNLPDISKKILSVIISNFSKNAIEVKFKGGKFVLQESVNAKIYDSGSTTKLYSKLTDEEKKQADGFYNKEGLADNYNMQRAIIELVEAAKHNALDKYLKLIALSEINGENRNEQIYNALYKNATLTNEQEARFSKDIDFSNIWFANLSEEEGNLLKSYISEGKLSQEFKDEYNGIKIPRKLKMIDDEGTPVAEVIMPMSGAIELAKKLGLKSTEELLKLTVGVRIPTSGFNTTLLLKVVGFTTGNRIIIPEEVSLIHGSDFDVDSLFVLNYEQYSSKEQEPLIKLEESASEIVSESKTLLEKKLNLTKGAIIGRDKNSKIIDNFVEKLEEVKSDIIERRIIDQVYYKEYEKLLNVLSDIEEKYWKNRSIDSYKRILNNEQNFSERMSPVAMDIIQNYLMGRIENEIYERSPKEARDLGLFGVKMKTHKDVFSSSQDIGIVASGIRTLSYLSYISRSRGSKLSLRLPDSEDDKSTVSIKFNGRNYTAESDTEIETKENFAFNVTRLYDAFLNGAVDDVKNQTMYILNFTSLTAGSYTIMTKFGVPFWTNYLFHAQPILSVTTTSNDFEKNIGAYERDIKAVLGIKETNMSLNDEDMKESLHFFLSKDITLSKAIQMLREDPSNIKLKKYLELQLASVKQFRQMKQMSSDLIAVSSMFNVTRRIPTDVAEINKILTTAKNRLKYLNIDFWKGDVYSEVAHTQQAINSTKEFMNNVVKQLSYANSNKLNGLVAAVSNFIDIEINRFNPAENEDYIRNEFIKYILSSYSFRNIEQSNKVVDSYESKYDLNSAETVKVVNRRGVPTLLNADDSWIESFCNKVQSESSKWMDSNMFLKYITIEKDDDGKQYIKFNLPASVKIEDKERIIADFIKLNPESRIDKYTDFQKGFLKYALIKNGVGFEATGFSQYLPIELRAGISNYLTNVFNKVTQNPLGVNNLIKHFALSMALKDPSVVKSKNNDAMNLNDMQKGYLKTNIDGVYLVTPQEAIRDIIVKEFKNESVVYYKIKTIHSEEMPVYNKRGDEISVQNKYITIYRKIGSTKNTLNYNMPSSFLTDSNANDRLEAVYSDMNHRIKIVNSALDFSKDSVVFSEYVKKKNAGEAESKFATSHPLKEGEEVYLRNRNNMLSNDASLFKVISIERTIVDGAVANLYRLKKVGSEYESKLDQIRQLYHDLIENAKSTKANSYLKKNILDLIKTHSISVLDYGQSAYEITGASVLDYSKVAELSENPYELLVEYNNALNSLNEVLGAGNMNKTAMISRAFSNGLRLKPESVESYFGKEILYNEIMKDKSRAQYFSKNGQSIDTAISEHSDLGGFTSQTEEYSESNLDITPEDIVSFIKDYARPTDYRNEMINKIGAFDLQYKFEKLTGVKLTPKTLSEMYAADKNQYNGLQLPKTFENETMDDEEMKEDLEDKKDACTVKTETKEPF